MIEYFSLEFWIAALFIINFILVLFLFSFGKKVNRLNLREPDTGFRDERQNDDGQASGSATKIIGMLEPLVDESRKTALLFDEQIKEKKRIIKELNDALDSRIISINLLLSRADALQKRLEEKQSRPGLEVAAKTVNDQQNQIIEMYNQQLNIDAIAQELSIPKGEVQLVIDLKKKFVAMENNSR